MNPTAFKKLVTSIWQTGRIRRGTLKLSRVTTFRPADVKVSAKSFAHRKPSLR